MASKVRRISLEDDFMDWRKDDIMYAYLLAMADFRMQDGILCLEKEVYYDCFEDIMEACDYKSKTSLRTNIKKWIESGLIEEKVIKEKDKKIPVFVMKNYDEKGKIYQMVDLQILMKLTDTKSKHCIQIYTYLLNKYKFKKKYNETHSEEKFYNFTLNELKLALGYSNKYLTNARVNQRINNILQDLKISGYIDYEIKYESKLLDDERIIQTPIRTLTFVAQSIEDLPTIE